MGSPYIVVERSVGHVRLFHILKYGRIVLSGKIPFCPEAVLEARVGARFSYRRSPEAGVLSKAWRVIIPKYFFPIVCPLLL